MFVLRQVRRSFHGLSAVRRIEGDREICLALDPGGYVHRRIGDFQEDTE